MNRLVKASFEMRRCCPHFASTLYPVALGAIVCLLVLVPVSGIPRQGKGKIAVDPQTGRAIGAKEMSAEELKRLFDSKGNALIIDVRDSASYEKETIPGAIHVPMDKLESKLKEIPKDTTLVFT